MPVLDVVKTATAAGVLAFYRALGETVEFALSENGPWATLYGSGGEGETGSADELDADTDQEKRTFWIPRQSVAGVVVFPPLDANGKAAIPTICLVRKDGQVYAVQSFKSEGRAGLFRLDGLLMTATVLGVKK
jgi:hypothetical protein